MEDITNEVLGVGNKKTNPDFWSQVEEDDLFERKKDLSSVKIKEARTRMNMNPVCGFQIMPELEEEFRRSCLLSSLLSWCL